MIENTNKHELYMNAYYRTLQAYNDNKDQDIRPVIKKLIICGVKAINTNPEQEYIEREAAEQEFQFIELIKDFMSVLTPGEFMRLYPIDKEYDGHKYQSKDYFYTMDYLKDLDTDKPIGREILNFLWEYQNIEISLFGVRLLCSMSKLQRLNGEKTVAEDLADMMGVKTYNLYTDSKGREYVFDKETGKTARAKKPKPRYLKVIK